MSWRPNAPLSHLKQGAAMRRSIRQWMDEKGVLEVCTPVLSRHATTDPHVPSVQTRDGGYLHTSPEFPMKRLLAAHAHSEAEAGRADTAPPDIYQIAPVFRAGEFGRYHNTEFTLLEWYRLGMDHHALMDDITNLLEAVWTSNSCNWPGVEKRYYGDEVRARLNIWPEQASVGVISQYFEDHSRHFASAIGNDLDAALDLFMDEFVLPDFSKTLFTILQNYPASQAALARLGKDVHGRTVAERFELYFGQIELANGFHELSDSTVQRQRFEADNVRRKASGDEVMPMDVHLLQALESGLPSCAGIALGLDRLQMVLGGHTHIQQVLSFDSQRA